MTTVAIIKRGVYVIITYTYSIDVMSRKSCCRRLVTLLPLNNLCVSQVRSCKYKQTDRFDDMYVSLPVVVMKDSRGKRANDLIQLPLLLVQHVGAGKLLNTWAAGKLLITWARG